MKRNLISYISVITFLLFTTTFVSAQVRPPVPRDSQKASVMQTIGTTEISITYSRPAVKGRVIYGDWPTEARGEATLDDGRARPKDAPIVPWGHIWRAGANEATLFVVADDVLVNGQLLAAGKYSLHMLPAKDGEWTVIFNKDDGQWGSFAYDAKKDALRVKTKVETTTDSSELLTYGITPVTATSAKVSLRWEKIKVPFTVEVKDVVASTMTRLKAYVAAAKPDDAGPRINAGLYAKANKQPDQAAAWFEEALKINDAQIAKMETFQNLQRKATILLNLDRKADAIAAAERAVTVGKTAGVQASDIEALEKRIGDMKTGKM